MPIRQQDGPVLVLAAALAFGGRLTVRNAIAADRPADLPGGPAAVREAAAGSRRPTGSSADG